MDTFMFQLTEVEFYNLKSQIATPRWGNTKQLSKRKNQIKTAGDCDEIKLKIFNNIISSK